MQDQAAVRLMVELPAGLQLSPEVIALHKRTVSVARPGADQFKPLRDPALFSRRDCWKRTEACFAADSLTGEFTGGDVLDDDRGYCGQGVAQVL